MERFDQEEHEANGHVPHHIFAQWKAERAKRLMQIIEREELWELEPWQAPIYTHYISPQDLLNNMWF